MEVDILYMQGVVVGFDGGWRWYGPQVIEADFHQRETAWGEGWGMVLPKKMLKSCEMVHSKTHVGYSLGL